MQPHRIRVDRLKFNVSDFLFHSCHPIIVVSNLVQGDLYKPDSQLLHLSGGFNLGDTNYNGKLHFERNDTSTRIELRRLLNLGRSSSPSGYEFVFETKNNRGTTQNTTIVSSHLSVRSGRQESSKVYNLQTTVVQANDSTNGSSLSLQGTLDCELSIRNSRIPETIELNYLHQTMSSQDETRRYTPSGARLKIEIKTKSNVLDLLIHHRHRQSAEPSKKGLKPMISLSRAYLFCPS